MIGALGYEKRNRGLSIDTKVKMLEGIIWCRTLVNREYGGIWNSHFGNEQIDYITQRNKRGGTRKNVE